MNHLDWCTHIKFKDDVDILTRKGFDVNMRLFHANPEYRVLITSICIYITHCATTLKDGYKRPHGWSGANAGIPFNIVALSTGECLINPKITNWSGRTKIVKTNCGSLTLEQPVEEVRDLLIDVTYFDLQGTKQVWKDIGPTPGFTLQHEIQHNQGFLLRNRPIARYSDMGE